MQKICRNCHFLTKYTVTPSGQRDVFVLNDKERKELKLGNMNCIESRFRLECYNLVWSEGAIGARRRDEIINKTNRRSTCFFFAYNSTMLLPGAEKLFKIQREKKERWRDRATGFVLGIIATILTGLVLYKITH